VLFLLLIWFLVRAHLERGWQVSRLLLVFVASLVPLWPFFLDRDIRRWIAASRPA
jgi:integral membrane protein